MTPKEKAEELVSKYSSKRNKQGLFILTFEESKQCALITVDEFIKNGCSIVYWLQVRNEIEKL